MVIKIEINFHFNFHFKFHFSTLISYKNLGFFEVQLFNRIKCKTKAEYFRTELNVSKWGF